jgi:hypothetical protein
LHLADFYDDLRDQYTRNYSSMSSAFNDKYDKCIKFPEESMMHLDKVDEECR